MAATEQEASQQSESPMATTESGNSSLVVQPEKQTSHIEAETALKLDGNDTIASNEVDDPATAVQALSPTAKTDSDKVSAMGPSMGSTYRSTAPERDALPRSEHSAAPQAHLAGATTNPTQPDAWQAYQPDATDHQSHQYPVDASAGEQDGSRRVWWAEAEAEDVDASAPDHVPADMEWQGHHSHDMYTRESSADYGAGVGSGYGGGGVSRPAETVSSSFSSSSRRRRSGRSSDPSRRRSSSRRQGRSRSASLSMSDEDLLPADASHFIRSQLSLLLRVARCRSSLPRVWRRRLDSLVSSTPFTDCSIILYLLPAVLLPFLPFTYYASLGVLVLSGLLVGQALQGTWAAATPARYSRVLLLLPRCSPHSMPALDLWMGPWAMGYLASRTGSPVAWVAVSVYLLAVVALRVYSLALMPHQLCASLAGGLASASLIHTLGESFLPRRINPTIQLVLGVLVGIGVLGVLAGYMESNLAPFGGVAREDFERVLGNIARGTDVTVSLEEVDAAADAVSQTLRQVRAERRRRQSKRRRERRQRGETGGESDSSDGDLDIDPTALRREVAQALVESARSRQDAELSTQAAQAEAAAAAAATGGVAREAPRDSWSLMIDGMRRRRAAEQLDREQRPSESVGDNVSVGDTKRGSGRIPRGSTRPPRMLRETDAEGADRFGDTGDGTAGNADATGGMKGQDDQFRDDGGVMGLLVEAARRAVFGREDTSQTPRRGTGDGEYDDGDDEEEEEGLLGVVFGESSVEREWGYGSTSHREAVTGLSVSKAHRAIERRRAARRAKAEAADASAWTSKDDTASYGEWGAAGSTTGYDNDVMDAEGYDADAAAGAGYGTTEGYDAADGGAGYGTTEGYDAAAGGASYGTAQGYDDADGGAGYGTAQGYDDDAAGGYGYGTTEGYDDAAAGGAGYGTTEGYDDAAAGGYGYGTTEGNDDAAAGGAGYGTTEGYDAAAGGAGYGTAQGYDDAAGGGYGYGTTEGYAAAETFAESLGNATPSAKPVKMYSADEDAKVMAVE